MPSTFSSTAKMTLADLPSSVEIHLVAFEGFFLSFLGPAFLTVLYRSILLDPSGIAYIHRIGNDVVGLVAGTSAPTGFYRKLLLSEWWRFAWAATIPAIKRPVIVPRLIRALSMPEQAKNSAGCGTIMSIAVHPTMQGMGIGRALVERFLEEARVRNLCCVDLTTDAENNESVNHFYQNLGFELSSSYTTPEGRRMNRYVIQCS